MDASLLVELLTEELPPKSLKTLGTVFGEEVLKGLERRKLRASGESALRIFATPRRLGALITGVLDKAAEAVCGSAVRGVIPRHSADVDECSGRQRLDGRSALRWVSCFRHRDRGGEQGRHAR